MRIFSCPTGVVLTAILFASAVQAATVVPGTRAGAEQHAVMNFSELAKREAQASSAPSFRELQRPLLPPGKLRLQSPVRQESRALLELLSLEPAPAMTENFLGLFDDRVTVPPDTMGAVGPNHIITMLNSQVRIQSRSTGAILSTVTLNAFWSSLSNPDTFDPHVTYDSFNNRWIVSCSADAKKDSASVLVGVSATSDPNGNWFLFRTDVDAANGVWADFDELGFNKNWVVITGNIFRNKGGFDGVWAWAYDKADLYANGSGTATLLKFVDADPNFFTFSVIPALMHDNSTATMYLMEDWDSNAGQLRVSTITGPIGSEVLNIGVSFPTSSSWEFAGGKNFAPQFDSKSGIDAGDSRLLSCVYRNGSLWASHTTFVPVGGPTHCVAQWWQVLPNGTVQQFGRVENSSGTQFFAYPSLAVNADDDMLLGYSRFSKSQFASANYSFRFGADAPGTLRSGAVLKAGEATYLKSAGGNNRWGDYSATCVDPANDHTLWTLQEYAGRGNSWSTWWGRIDPDPDAIKIGLTRPADGISYPTAPTVTLTATRFDEGATFTKVEFFSDGQKIGEETTEPYTITWTGAADGTHSLQAIATLTGGGSSTSALAAIAVGDPASPVGIWEAKLTGPGKGVAVLNLGDDFSITGHGILVGTFGLFDLTGSWSYNSSHQTIGSLLGVIEDRTVLQADFLAKVKPGKLSVATTSFTGLKALKMKGVPLQPVPDLSGSWNGAFKASGGSLAEVYDFVPSPTHLNVLDFTADGPSASLTGAVLVTVRSGVGLATTNAPLRSMNGKLSSSPSISLKGVNNINESISLKLTKP